MQELVNAEVVAKRIGEPRWRVYELVRSGYLPAVRLGARRLKFDEAAIEHFIQSGGSVTRGDK